MYEGGPGYIRQFLPIASVVVALFWVPENRFVLLVRSVLFWGFSFALVHRFSLTNDIYLKDNFVIQPALFLLGCFIGFGRYRDLAHVLVRT